MGELDLSLAYLCLSGESCRTNIPLPTMGDHPRNSSAGAVTLVGGTPQKVEVVPDRRGSSMIPLLSGL